MEVAEGIMDGQREGKRDKGIEVFATTLEGP
jgi:hypothetical protein